jgi:hypothetical protein
VTVVEFIWAQNRHSCPDGPCSINFRLAFEA